MFGPYDMRYKSWRYRKHMERAYITPRFYAPRVEKANEKRFVGYSISVLAMLTDLALSIQSTWNTLET